MKLRYLALIAAAVVLSRCNVLEEGADEFNGVRLVNNMTEEVWILAMELESSHLIDPMPWIDFDDSGALQAWASGEEQEITRLQGYTYGDDIRLFIYTKGTITVDGRPPVVITALILGPFRDATHAELLESSGLIDLGYSTAGD